MRIGIITTIILLHIRLCLAMIPSNETLYKYRHRYITSQVADDMLVSIDEAINDYNMQSPTRVQVSGIVGNFDNPMLEISYRRGTMNIDFQYLTLGMYHVIQRLGYINDPDSRDILNRYSDRRGRGVRISLTR